MYLADLHIHSRFSRATSKDCDLPHLDFWARRKGITLVGTGDFTHPAWRQELQQQLVQGSDGFYHLKNEFLLEPDGMAQAVTPRFVVTGEISCIYKRHGKTRKVHNVIILPDLEAAELLSRKLEAIGNIHSDGRPILGLDSRDLLEITLDSCPEAIFVPAHIWTPHFSMFGAFSGFDTMEECFGDLTDCIHAVETGLSSDPPMNWRVSALDGLQLVSNSDAHSPSKLGREVNILDGEPSFSSLSCAIQTGQGLAGTVEFFPEEGKYHLDGHRNCKVRLTPGETQALDGLCPVCGRKLTIGVEHRVEELADRPAGTIRPNAKPFERLVPLTQIIAASINAGEGSKKVQRIYEELLGSLGPEFYILRQAPLEDIGRQAGLCICEGIRRVRAGQVERLGGYDGEYGTISLFRPDELEELNGQMSLLPHTDQSSAPIVRPLVPSKSTVQEPSIASPNLLNEQQKEAVCSQAFVTAVTAGPGTGKTKTLVEHIVFLIQECGVQPEEITAVTFTRLAAKEMEQRLVHALGSHQSIRGIQIGTFHSLCLKQLDTPLLISPDQALELAREILKAHSLKRSPRTFLEAVSRFKNGMSDSETFPIQEYIAALEQLGLMDLDDILSAALKKTLSSDQKKHLKYLLVDEFQDTNPIQFALVQKWHQCGKHLFVIGDDDQAIYGFRGAGGHCFEQLCQVAPHAQVIRFLENYRSSAPILDSALSLIRHNPGPKRILHSHHAGTASLRLIEAPSAYSEAIFLAKEIARMTGGVDMLTSQSRSDEKPRAFSDIAVLCRTHRQLELIENCLLHDGIPCTISGRDDFLSDEAVCGAIGFFRHLFHFRDELSLRHYLSFSLHCPEDLIQRAIHVCSCSENWESIQSKLETEGFYGQWFEQVNAFLPLIKKENPYKLLNAFWKNQPLRGPQQKLLDTAVFHKTMSAFLDTLLLGSESDIVRASRKEYSSGAVRLMTLHGSKGLEFPVVFLAGLSSGIVPLQDGHSCLEEERRLLYVGVTRAMEELVLSFYGEPSCFLNELKTPNLRHETLNEPFQASKFQQLSFL
ncbi:UvrD-helicase domain-containing protein [uncultured Ruthenibacterium sp.]|uniref:UvrD-helicase domain-containing protein n=1 Tax=uncultured Ruthenibacterium sp. TaxID=1905347 RepID=UPI00349E930A